mmetsp:Transcript_7026/g.12890  ORF Transcript_7026/g.12890 Transcript_7026/m.12890 type:complete len:242 (+) Transcript_7026:553-1278(+)
MQTIYNVPRDKRWLGCFATVQLYRQQFPRNKTKMNQYRLVTTALIKLIRLANHAWIIVPLSVLRLVRFVNKPLLQCICPNLDPVEQYRRLLWPLTGKALEDSTSPQFQALEWSANTDTHGAMDSSQVCSRTVVLAFRGESWPDQSNFLSHDNICQRNTENAGIQCNERNQVTSICLPNNHLQSKIPSEIKVFSSLGILYLKVQRYQLIAARVTFSLAAFATSGFVAQCDCRRAARVHCQCH